MLVFLKDISRQTMENLITFMYTGEVNVPPESLTEFLQTADALKIKGLAANNRSQTSTDMPELSSYSFLNAPEHVVRQHQTCQINPMHRPAMSYHRTDESSLSGPSCCDQKILNDMMENIFPEHDIHELFPDHYFIEEITPDVPNEPIQEPSRPFEEPSRPIEEPSRPIKYGYNILADVRSIEGHEYLIHENYKFGRHGPMSEPEQKQRWRCTRNRTAKCSAAVSTIKVNSSNADDVDDSSVSNVYMMKVLNGEHSHEPPSS